MTEHTQDHLAVMHSILATGNIQSICKIVTDDINEIIFQKQTEYLEVDLNSILRLVDYITKECENILNVSATYKRSEEC